MLEGAVFHGKEVALRHAGVLSHGRDLRFDGNGVRRDITHDPAAPASLPEQTAPIPA